MKKLITLVLTLVMLVSAAAMTANAGMYVDADFTNMDSLTSHFHAGLFYTDDSGTLFGYSEAKCLQSKGEWYRYDAAVEVAFEDDDMSETPRSIAHWYCNINPESYGRYDGTVYMIFGYDIEAREFYLSAPDLTSGEGKDLAARVPYELEDGEYYEFGISVTEKRIRGFIDGECVIEFYDEADEYLIGRQDEYTDDNPHVFWNEGNFICLRDYKIASEAYLFPFPAETETTTTAAPSENLDPADTTTKAPAEVQTSEATTRIESEVVTDDKGETSIVTKVITEATTTPKAETNVHNNNGGSSTSTGDSVFVVVAAMIATIGCAVVVKKVGVR